MTAGDLTFDEADEQLNNLDPAQVIEALRTWHPTVLAELLKAVTKARYIRYKGSHPDWTAAVREIVE